MLAVVDRDDARIGIAFDRKVKKSGNVVKGFRAESVSDVFSFLERGEDKSLYEVVPAKNIRPFFDIDFVAEDDSDRDAVRVTAVEGCKHILSLMYPKGVGELKVFDGSRATDDGFKHSLHIIAPRVVHPSASTLLSLLHRWIKKTPVVFNGTPLIDNAIYTQRRCFRMMGQSKLGQGTPLVGEYDDISDTLVGAYGNREGMTRPTDWVIPPPDEPYRPEHHLPDTTGHEELVWLLNQMPSDIPRNYWVVILNVIANLDAPFDIADTWSKNGKKRYKGRDDVEKFWNDLCFPNYTIKSLQAYVSQYNPSYIAWRTDKAPWADFEFDMTDHAVEIQTGKYIAEIPNDHGLYLLCAQEGAGKTTQIVKFLQRPENTGLKVIMLVPRITLADGMTGVFLRTGLRFTSYLDTKKANVCAQRSIFSFESLHRYSGRRPDIVIVDESETFCRSLTGVMMDAKGHGSKNIETLRGLFTPSTMTIGGDSNLSGRSIGVLESLTDTKAHIVVHQPPRKRRVIRTYPKNLKGMMAVMNKNIENGKKAFFMSLSRTAIERYLGGRDDIMFFHRDMNEKKRKEMLLDPDASWPKFNVVATTPTITVGIDMSKPAFDACYLYTCPGSCTPMDAIQGFRRVRNPTGECDHWAYIGYGKGRYIPVKERLIQERARLDELVKRGVADPTPEFIRIAHAWNEAEAEISKFANGAWTAHLLRKRGYDIVEETMATEKATPLYSASKVEYGDVYTLSEAEGEELLTIASGRNRDVPADAITRDLSIELNKYRLRKLFNVSDGDDFPKEEAKALWSATNRGSNLTALYLARALTFSSFKQAPQRKVLDIKYGYKREQFELMEPVAQAVMLRYERGVPIDETFEKAIMKYIKANATKFKDMFRISPGSKEPMKTITALLGKTTFFTLENKQVRVKGKRERKYFLKPRFPYGYASLQVAHNIKTGVGILTADPKEEEHRKWLVEREAMHAMWREEEEDATEES
ncbi:hypothetical protein FNF29_01313 [Cafeteria roenbergensis]|uniref:Replication origin-binding protein domain-containing protein n=1 Tax=Cafeteria roenbergensis TaxID=33653 RepID=A0A5A8CU02_CAFRO|nr:hypothetical protein FNF29_01313 [Cafeteria roenbergensis]|eukprot:KAA0155894.1 hypothetical protein FNF29_01313 [Cafeteria roenbergensis]